MALHPAVTRASHDIGGSNPPASISKKFIFFLKKSIDNVLKTLYNTYINKKKGTLKKMKMKMKRKP